MASSMIQLVNSSLINAITRKGQEGRFPLLALPLMIKVLGRAEGLEEDIIT